MLFVLTGSVLGQRTDGALAAIAALMLTGVFFLSKTFSLQYDQEEDFGM